MLCQYPGAKLRNLRKRALLTQKQAASLASITRITLYNAESERRKPQTATLERLLNLYAIRIRKLEHYEQIWGEDGIKSPSQSAAIGPIQPPPVAKRTRTRRTNKQSPIQGSLTQAPAPVNDAGGGLQGNDVRGNSCSGSPCGSEIN